MYRACFADGSTLRTCGPGATPWRSEIARRVRCRRGRRLRSLLRLAHRASPLSRCPPSSTATTTRPSTSLATRCRRCGLARLGGFGRLDRAVGRFFADDRLRRLFSFQALYAGVAPHRALALYAVITYMDTVGGVYFPEGGMHAVPRALAAAAERAGVKIRYRRRVERIVLARGGGGRRARRPARRWRALAADARRLHRSTCPSPTSRLLPGLERAAGPRGGARTRRRRWCGTPASRARRPASVAHHNIHFGQAWRACVRGPDRPRAGAWPTRRSW